MMPPFPFPLSKLSLRFDEQAATIPWFFRAAVVPLLNPHSSQQFLVPRELEVALRRFSVWLRRLPFSSTLPPSFKDHFLYCSFQDKVQNGMFHTESSAQVSVHTELNSRALIIGYEGRQVVGRGGFKKTRSRQQRQLPPRVPWASTPHQKPFSKPLSTAILKEKLWQRPEGDHLQSATMRSAYSATLPKCSTGGYDEKKSQTIHPAPPAELHLPFSAL